MPESWNSGAAVKPQLGKAWEANRLVWAIPLPDTWKTGGQKYNLAVANHLREEGWQLEFYSPPRGTSRRRMLRNMVSSWQITADLLRISRSGDLVVQCAEWHSRFLVPNIVLRLLKHIRIVAVCHHLPPRDLLSRRSLNGSLLRTLDWLVVAAYLRTTHQVIAVSESTRRDIERTGFPRERIAIVPDGFDRPNPPEVARSASRLRVIFVGHCIPLKGVEYLIEAIGLIGNPRLRLDVVGSLSADPKYAARLQELATACGIADRTEFHGRVPESKLWELYGLADIFVLPSLWEGFGIVLLEAMAAGLPIVATEVGAIPELVTHGYNGLLVPPRDSQSLAKALSHLAANPELRYRLGSNGRSRSEKSLTWTEAGHLFSRELGAVAFSLNRNR